MRTCKMRIAAAVLAASVAVTATGCASKALDGSQTVATVGEQTLTLGEANFYLRYNQAETESYYKSLVGDDLYTMDLYGDGSTYGDIFKNDIMDQMQEYLILEAKAADYELSLSDEEKAAAKEAAESFIAANDSAALKQMTADAATVERVMDLVAIGQKVKDAVYAEANVTVTDEEAAQRKFDYVYASTSSQETDADGNAVALTDEEIQALKDKLNTVIESVKAGDDMSTAADAAEMTSSTGTYGQDSTNYDTAVIEAADALAEGEVSDIVETESGMLYVLQVVSDYDEEATESKRASLQQTKESEYYQGVLDGWKEEYPLTVDDAVWSQVVFDRAYNMKTEETAE